MNKFKHKIWVEFRSKNETDGGSIEFSKLTKIFKDLEVVGKKHEFQVYIMGLPKDVLNYKPTGEEIKIERLSDCVEKLAPQQFEMFMIDLRKWVDWGRQVKDMLDNKEKINEALSKMGVEVKAEENWEIFKEGMKWLDTGEHKMKTDITIES